MKNLFLALVGAFFLTSCCDCIKGSPKIGELESAKWTLVDLDNKAVENSGIVLTFDANEKMIYGQAPCNNFFAGYSLEKGKTNNIRIGVGGSTRKACPEAMMDLEQRLTSKLQSVVTIRMEGAQMMMLDTQGNLVAVFQKAE